MIFCGEMLFLLRKGDLSLKEKGLWQIDITKDWLGARTPSLFFSCPRCGKINRDDLIAVWSSEGTAITPHSRICRHCQKHLWLIYKKFEDEGRKEWQEMRRR